MKFLKILKAVMTFGTSVEILLDHCVCGNRDVEVFKRTRDNKWYVYCASCRAQSTPYRFKRKTMRAWNKDMKEARGR